MILGRGSATYGPTYDWRRGRSAMERQTRPPPPPWTNMSKDSTFPQLRLRAVKISKMPITKTTRKRGFTFYNPNHFIGRGSSLKWVKVRLHREKRIIFFDLRHCSTRPFNWILYQSGSNVASLFPTR